MSIEFKCPSCEQTLRVPDEAAGKQARCPNCQTVAAVPLPSAGDAGQPDSPAPFADSAASGPPSPPANPNPFGEFGSRAPVSTNPYASPQAVVEKQATIRGKLVPTPADAGDVINYAFEVWKDNLGILVGVFVFMTAVNWMLAFLLAMVDAGIQQAVGRTPELAMALNLISQVVLNVVQIYLGIGAAQISLRLARGERAEFADLFRGGPRFFPVLGVSILLGLALVAGFLLLIIPGLIVAILFWPVYYLVVDEKTGVTESFSTAYQFSKLNVGTTILLALAGIGISILGVLALCIGLIFAAPLVSMMWAVGYLMMSGQIASRRFAGPT